MPSSPVAAPNLNADFDAQRKRNVGLIVGATALVVLAGLFFGLRAAGLLKLGGEQPMADNLKVGSTLPDNSLGKLGNTAPAVLERPATAAPTAMQKPAQRAVMPKDVEDWLNHLARIEAKKQEISARQQGEMMAVMTRLQGAGGLTVEGVKALTDPDGPGLNGPLQDLSQQINGWKSAWVALDREFRSVPPPAECQSIATNYSVGLNSNVDAMSDVSSMVGGFDGESPNATAQAGQAKVEGTRINRDSSQNGDNRFQAALDGVDAVCTKYGVRRWFNIDVHGPTSGVFGKGGFGG